MSRIAYLSGDVDADLKLFLESVHPCHSEQFHCEVVRGMKTLGYEVKRNVTVGDRGDGARGRIDVIARRDAELIALELDHSRPRKKSLFKIKHYPNATGRIVVCRY